MSAPVLQARPIATSRFVVTGWAVGIVVLAAYCYVVSASRPFTSAADAALSVGFAGVGAVGLGTVLRRRTARLDRRRRPGALWLWLAVVSLVAGWELVTYFAGFGGHRRAWPTISSLTDIAFRYQAAKGAAVAVWIALGLALVRR